MWSNPMAAGTAVLNGAGELTGSIEIREWGVLESPVVLVSTNNIGRGYDALVDAALAEGVDDVVVPVVGECDDSWLDDITPSLADRSTTSARRSTPPPTGRSPRASSAPAPA